MKTLASIAFVTAMILGGSQASAQSAPAPAPATPQNPGGGGGGPLGAWRGASNNPGSGSGDLMGSFSKAPEEVAGMPKGAYGIELARRMDDARRLVDAVDEGKVLTDSDARHVRDLMRDDFIAWKKRYDLLPSNYRAERDRWIVDESALSPNEWAKHRLDWLEAQREWIISHGG